MAAFFLVAFLLGAVKGYLEGFSTPCIFNYRWRKR